MVIRGVADVLRSMPPHEPATRRMSPEANA